MLRRRRTLLTLLAAGVATVAIAAPTAQGYNTPQDEMLTPLAGAPAGYADALLSTGRHGPIGGYMFKTIPDGVSILPKGNGLAEVYVNHETSTVPFPYNAPLRAGGEANQNDFENTEVSELVIHGPSSQVVQGSLERSRASRTTSGSARTTSQRSPRASRADPPVHERGGAGLGLPPR